MAALSTRLVWMLFAVSLGALGVHATVGLNTAWGDLLRIDGLTLIMATVVTFVSGIVHSYARRYMDGSLHQLRFYGRLLALTLVVLLLTAANHLALFAACWALMGWLLADLIGLIRGWPQAQAAARRARWSFLGGSALLAAALGLIAGYTETATISEALLHTDMLPTSVLAGVSVLLVGAAMIQSALIPFHGWLLSSMTAPTPVSAFMHAGLVNAGGLLLARFAPVVAGLPVVMLAIVAVGALSALLAQAWMLIQADVKRQLGCSTVAQMGFMVLQCGLGFFAAAIAHLILHGFYKAYLFLASGSVVTAKQPPKTSSSAAGGGTLAIALFTGLVGGGLFAWLTGKSVAVPDGGLLLTLVVVLAVLHAGTTVLRTTALGPLARAVALPLVVLPAIALYAGVYNGIAALTVDLPMAVVPAEASIVHGIVGMLFVLAYVATERGWHRERPRLYTALLNMSQPASATLTNRRSDYHAH
ncbi:oxidoreductase [Longimonas halophila]|uniref:Oxidoreductase n=1 Tax=Longimonas halophila TaxID=1469170 RepID=A0A2H3P7X3_9BACT|nr:proton-conducting transporter membrane subunit [Longimonas halophila]PEN07725.1 oxidoreductase [Longimonas halophila]